MNRIHNFSPGPAILPFEVLQQIQGELLDYRQKEGVSIMEISHRSDLFLDLYQELQTNLRSLYEIPQSHEILYMTGGATTQYSLIPLNLADKNVLESHESCAYIDSGHWAKKAIQGAKENGFQPVVVASGESSGYRELPNVSLHATKYAFLHGTSNNTIYGTQMQTLPDSGETPLILDMSSDFLSKPAKWEEISLGYASAQKNAGTAGLTIVVINKKMMERSKMKFDLPSLWRYDKYAMAESSLNTPPIFQMYLLSLVIKWLKKRGGLYQVHKDNQKKAALIYHFLDKYPDFYRGFSIAKNRSLMNITWFLPNEKLTREFLERANKEKFLGLKGHKASGGIRASTYNAVPLQSCEALAHLMNSFYHSHNSC